jgi:hypothetical protein
LTGRKTLNSADWAVFAIDFVGTLKPTGSFFVNTKVTGTGTALIELSSGRQMEVVLKGQRELSDNGRSPHPKRCLAEEWVIRSLFSDVSLRPVARYDSGVVFEAKEAVLNRLEYLVLISTPQVCSADASAKQGIAGE